MEGDYPAGASFDDRAPFNQEQTTCHICDGTGIIPCRECESVGLCPHSCTSEGATVCQVCDGDGIIIK